MAVRVLIVEDDVAFAQVIADNLRYQGYEVSLARNGDEAISQVRASQHDLVLLDLMLPKRDGFDVCDVISQRGRVPVIIISARSQKADRLRGLQLGADDYLTKPFDLDELLARMQAVLRRRHRPADLLKLGGVTIDFAKMKAWSNRRALHLTDREFELLRFLAERKGQVVYRSELFREVWGSIDVHPSTRMLDHAITRLRKKIEPDPHHPRYIRTVHGDGFRLTATAEPDTH
jgi:DNA-binding response OmpR family regulator